MPEIKEGWGLSDITMLNATLVASVLAASAGAWPKEEGRKPLFSVLLPLYVAFMHLFLLRRVLCRNCHYYGMNCCTGWGRLAPLWGEKGDEAKFKSCLTLPAAFWMTYPAIGVGGILAAFRHDRDKGRLKYLALFAFFNLAFNAWHVRRACLYCYNREECPKGKSALKMLVSEVDI
jgi:hypothetical protein